MGITTTMSIIRTKSNSYGPATLDLQIEQGCDLALYLALTNNSVAWNLTGLTLEALLSPTWSPGASEIDMTVTVTNAAAGALTISLPGSATLNLGLPSPPSRTRSPSDSRLFALGGWAFYITDGIRTRLIEGDVTLDRDPAQG